MLTRPFKLHLAFLASTPQATDSYIHYTNQTQSPLGSHELWPDSSR